MPALAGLCFPRAPRCARRAHAGGDLPHPSFLEDCGRHNSQFRRLYFVLRIGRIMRNASENKWGKARANPHSERDHRYRRRTHRGECGAVPSSALSKNHSCCGINSDPRPVFRQRRALLGSRGGESHRNLGRRGRITHPHSFRTRESARFRLHASASLQERHALVRSGTPELMRGDSTKPSSIGRFGGRKRAEACLGGPYRQMVGCWTS